MTASHGSCAAPGLRRAAIVATGVYVPSRIMTNFDIEKLVDTTDEWIVTRSGIRERRIAAENEATSDMAAIAAQRALAAAGLAPETVDQIIVATVTPDMGFPNTACFVQSRLGARKAHCFDLEAACSGFLYGVDVARHFIAAGAVETSLVIGAEKLSIVTDWQDRATCVLFGDGAGAAVIRPAARGRGIIGSVMVSDGTLHELLNLPGGGSRNPASHQTLDARMHYMKMNGKEVFKHAVRAMTEVSRQVLTKCELTIDDIACIIPHQANMRILQAIAERLGLGLDRFYINLEKYGNMSAASVPVALAEAVQAGRVKRGDLVLMVAFGGGFTWGATIIEW